MKKSGQVWNIIESIRQMNFKSYKKTSKGTRKSRQSRQIDYIFTNEEIKDKNNVQPLLEAGSLSDHAFIHSVIEGNQIMEKVYKASPNPDFRKYLYE